MLPLANIGNPALWIVIAVALLVLFGGQKIPELMRGLGQGTREFKKGLSGDEDDELRKEREHEAEVRARVEAEMRREREGRSGTPTLKSDEDSRREREERSGTLKQ